MSNAGFSIDPDLERQLLALGPNLAVPSDKGLLDAVLDRLGSVDRAADDGGLRWRRLLVAAVVTLVVSSAGLVAYEPARTAVAGWLGIGAVQFTPVDQLPPVSAGSNTTPAPATASPAQAVEDAQRRVSFPIRLPDATIAGPVRGVETNAVATGGLASITFDRFVLTEIASQANQGPVVAKLLPPGTKLEFLLVNGRDGAWISGAPHELGYIDPNGQFRNETVRRAGNVLVWEQDGVTYRVEGLESKDDALAVAASLR